MVPSCVTLPINNILIQKYAVKMKINPTVSNEHHFKLLSSVVTNMVDSPFNDITLVCSDGQLRVNGLLLALLLPASYRRI